MRINLEVPFSDKELAKSLGARWDPARKIWFALNVENLSPLMRWMPLGRKNPTPRTPSYSGSVTPKVVASSGAKIKKTAPQREPSSKRGRRLALTLFDFCYELDAGQRHPSLHRLLRSGRSFQVSACKVDHVLSKDLGGKWRWMASPTAEGVYEITDFKWHPSDSLGYELGCNGWIFVSIDGIVTSLNQKEFMLRLLGKKDGALWIRQNSLSDPTSSLGLP